MHGSLWRAGAYIENNEFLVAPPPGSEERGDSAGVALYEIHQARSLGIGQGGAGDR